MGEEARSNSLPVRTIGYRIKVIVPFLARAVSIGGERVPPLTM